MKTAKELRLNIIDLFDAHQVEVMRMSREEISEGHLMERSNSMIKQFIGEVEEYATQAKGGGMTSDRIKEIQEETAYPESVSVYHALHKVWNECAQAKGGSGEVEQHKGYHMSDGDTSSTPPVTPQEDEKQNVFSRDECIFTYCPHPEECKDVCQCTADDLNKKIEKNNKVIEKMRDLSNIDMNAPYGATQQPTPSTHSEVGETKVIQKQDSAYHLACQNCGTSSKPLQMIPFRNDNNVVGLLTSCEDCKDILYGQRFDREEKLTPTKPVEITEEEIINIWIEYYDQIYTESLDAGYAVRSDDAMSVGAFIRAVKAILTKLNGER